MTAERVKDGHAFSCDECGQVWEPPKLGIGSSRREFGESWELAKEEGWRAILVNRPTKGSDWQHRCPEC